MTVYGEFKKDRIRFSINGEEISIKVGTKFYSKADKKESYHMFTDKAINKRIQEFVNKHRNKLPLLEKLKYIFLRNTVVILVDKDVQPVLTMRLIQAYATLSLDARAVDVIKKPDDFFDNHLESIESIRNLNLNDKNLDIPISKLSEQ
jgi:hypothetical protein